MILGKFSCVSISKQIFRRYQNAFRFLASHSSVVCTTFSVEGTLIRSCSIMHPLCIRPQSAKTFCLPDPKALIGNSRRSLNLGLLWNVNATGSTATAAAIIILHSLLKAWISWSRHRCSRCHRNLRYSRCYSRTTLLRKENHGPWPIRYWKLVGGKMFILHWWKSQSTTTAQCWHIRWLRSTINSNPYPRRN